MSPQDQELEQAAEPSSPPTDNARDRRAMRDDLLRLGRVGGRKAAASTSAVLQGHADLDRYAAKWLPLAEHRQDAAVDSPADQARWAHLIKAVTRPPAATAGSYETLVLRAGYARDLLRALTDTLPPWVPIADVARQIKKRITNGAYPPGAILAPGRLAADLALPLPSIELALSDLAKVGVVEQRDNCRVRVAGGHLELDRPHQVAATLREFIQHGVFPPGVALPKQRELCRILVTSQKPLSGAMRILLDEKLLEHGEFKRKTVRRGAVQRPKSPADLPQPVPDLSPDTDEVREAVRRARSWWKTRLSPAPDALDTVIGQLIAGAHRLADHARTGPLPPTTTHQQVTTLIARTAVTAAAALRPDYLMRVWHAACLATAVSDLLDLLAPVDIGRPVGVAAAPISA